MTRTPDAVDEAYYTLSEMINGKVTLANVRMVVVVAGLVAGWLSWRLQESVQTACGRT